jgi:hypothetical protein
MNLYSLPDRIFKLQLKIAIKMSKISRQMLDETNRLFVYKEDRARFDQLEKRRNRVIEIGKEYLNGTRRNKEESR